VWEYAHDIDVDFTRDTDVEVKVDPGLNVELVFYYSNQ
jgi:hypothetical protein